MIIYEKGTFLGKILYNTDLFRRKEIFGHKVAVNCFTECLKSTFKFNILYVIAIYSIWLVCSCACCSLWHRNMNLCSLLFVLLFAKMFCHVVFGVMRTFMFSIHTNKWCLIPKYVCVPDHKNAKFVVQKSVVFAAVSSFRFDIFLCSELKYV